MKILLLGKNGQVGWELQRSLAPLGQVIALGSNEADFSKADAVLRQVEAHQPKVIVNAAAYTAVDKAESEPDLARQINALTPIALAKLAAQTNALLVHYSTDYVFDGKGDEARNELSPTGPLGVYGRTKLESEHGIADTGCAHLIFRTSWVYAARGGNFARTMLKLAADRDQLRVIADQIGAPTGADLIADVTALTIRDVLRQPGLQGLYHLVASGQTSWHEYACFVIDWARARGVPIKVPQGGVEPIKTSEYPTPAQRPLNSKLNTQKLQTAFDLKLPDWQVGVERMLMEVYPS